MAKKSCASSVHLNSFPTFRFIKFAFFVFCNVANLTESYANNARWKAMVCNAISPDARIPLSSSLPACVHSVHSVHCTLCRVCLLCAHTVYNAGYVRSHPCPISLSATPILHHHYLRLMLQLDTVLSHNSCMKALPAAVTKLPKVSPDFSPIVLFRGRDIWSSGAPHVVGGEYIGGRGDPIIQIISPPGLRMNHIFGRNCVQQSIAMHSSHIWWWATR